MGVNDPFGQTRGTAAVHDIKRIISVIRMPSGSRSSAAAFNRMVILISLAIGRVGQQIAFRYNGRQICFDLVEHVGKAAGW